MLTTKFRWSGWRRQMFVLFPPHLTFLSSLTTINQSSILTQSIKSVSCQSFISSAELIFAVNLPSLKWFSGHLELQKKTWQTNHFTYVTSSRWKVCERAGWAERRDTDVYARWGWGELGREKSLFGSRSPLTGMNEHQTFEYPTLVMIMKHLLLPTAAQKHETVFFIQLLMKFWSSGLFPHVWEKIIAGER